MYFLSNHFFQQARNCLHVLLCTFAITLSLVGTYVSAATAPGTLIHNRAEIIYFDTGTGSIIRTQSNNSTVEVARVFRAKIEGPSTHIAHAAKFLGLPFRIQNTGNAADSFSLNVENLTGDSGDVQSLFLIHDINGNGIADAGEPVISETPRIEPGNIIELVVAGNIPSTAIVDEQYQVGVSAVGNNANQPLNATTTITIVDGAFISLTKSSESECSVPTPPNTDINYRIDFTNSGNREPESQTVLIDGILRTGVLIRDNIPAGTQLLPNQNISFAPIQGLPIVLENVSESQWLSYSAWDRARPAASFGLFVPAENMAPGQSGNFLFSLRVIDLELPNALVENIAGVDIDGDGQFDFESNAVCNLIDETEPDLGAAIDATDATLSFQRPSPELQRQNSTPDFFNEEHFVESGSFRINSGSTSYQPIRDGLYLELRTTGLPPGTIIGTDSRGASYVLVTLESELTGDTLQVVMLETEPESGIFRNIRPIGLSLNDSGNGQICPGGDRIGELAIGYEIDAPECVLTSASNDVIRAILVDGNQNADIILTASVVVSPTAIVFDAFTRNPVPGARVSIRQGGAPAAASAGIFDDGEDSPIVPDIITNDPLVAITNAQGEYDIPPLLPGDGYYLFVEPPENFIFPSQVAPEDLIGLQVTPASYGPLGVGESSGVFSIREGDATPIGDIPLDPADSSNRLSIEKRALQVEVEPGDVVGYTVTVTNRTDEEQFNVRVGDRVPFGFKLISGTTRVDNEPAAEPLGTPGYELDFPLGTLLGGESRELTYVLEATAGSIDGDGINKARASARTNTGVILRSAESRARVRINRDSALSDRAALFGKVYIDSDCNNIQNDAEWPIGGVRLYLDDGSFAITDENGQYSLYGLEPGTRVLRADPLTVPEGLTFKPLDNANAAVGDSRFVHLSPGDFHRADFAATCPVANIEKVFEEIRARNATIDGSWLLEEAERFSPNNDTQDTANRGLPNINAADIDGDLSNGILNGPDTGRTRSEKRIEDKEEAELENQKKLIPAVAPKAPLLDPKTAVATITNEQAKLGTWLWPESDTSLDGRFIAVIRAGIDPTLFVNGEAIADTQIGERIENRRESAQVVAWYGVQLSPGLNRVEIRGTDTFGNTRVLAENEFKRPAQGTRMVLRAKTDTLSADGGRSVLPIEINILDDNGYPAQGVHFVTLDAGSNSGGWLEDDLQASEDGQQIRVDEGRATAHLKSSDYTGTVTVSASANDMNAKLRVFQIATLRPLFGVGVLELNLGATELSSDGLTPTAHADGAEDGTEIDGRISMFLKGQIRGNTHLTLSYDSDKTRDTDLLRDIEPGAHYPIHGDASIRGYEGQSRSKLYAKLERGKNSILWGDYVTDVDGEIDNLARQQRVLTGFNSRYDTGRASFQVYAAMAEEGRRFEEIPGNGTALLYQLQGAPIIANSELVEIIVRDRENPGLVISQTRLVRFGDYTIDSISGELSFADVIPSFDDELNPIFLRVTYDQENGGEEHLVAGARAHFNITDSLTAGASFSDDSAPIDGGSLGGGYLAWRPSDNTTVSASAARATHNNGDQAGNAQRLSIEQRWGSSNQRTTSIVAANADAGFNTADAGIGAGRREVRLEHRERFSSTLRGEIEGTLSESTESDELRSTFGGTLTKSYRNWTLRGGARRIRQRTSGTSDEFTTAIVGAERRFTVGGRNASADIEYEQDATEAARNRVSLGTRIQLRDHLQLNARYERESGIYDFSSGGTQSTNESFIAGLESDAIKNTRLYSEYRMRGGIGGRDLATASGIRGNYEVANGLKVSPALEVVNSIAGDDSGDGVAISVGVSDTRNPNVRASAQAEYRMGRDSDLIGLRANYAARLNLDWTAIASEDFRLTDPDEGQVETRHALTLGLARRPRLNNRHHMLFQYQWKVDRADGETLDRDTHVLSTHQNFQLGAGVTLAGRLGGKQQTNFLIDRDFKSAAYLADIRVIMDLSRRWTVDLRTGILATGSGESIRHSFGAGVSYLVDRNLELHLGYNTTGFRDEDLDGEGYNAHGVRFGIRYKFNENLFHWLNAPK